MNAHSSRMHEEALTFLRSNNIDMLILPAHSTSIFQPLDRGLYVPYKNSFRELYKEGVYIRFYILRVPLSKRPSLP